MALNSALKKSVDSYYAALEEYKGKNVTHETALRSAFQSLLAAFAQTVGWTLVPEQKLTVGKHIIRPDGTLRDAINLRCGYWEAKDADDDLDVEIRKKITSGYPTTNSIFEDTRRAVLYQDGRREFEADLTQQRQLIDLLERFIHYKDPNIEGFERAVREFKETIPDLAHGLKDRIKAEHARNKAFVAAFGTFLELCHSSLDPHMSSETVDEMLVQHLLTERLFRTIFNNPDFANRNVIAREIEKVIQALTSREFNRYEFLKSLDRYYIAIEEAARTLPDWTEKQHFLNTVYESFFQGFSTKQADTHGIVYTPQEIVDFMCASVDVVLQREFSTSLSEPSVQILDPATGTGNFLVNLIQKHINGSDLAYKYQNDLFCNEIMLLPYYIASLNIEHAYYERTHEYTPFEGIAFADTLNIEGQRVQQEKLAIFSERNTERVIRENNAPIMVVIGNPPYNVGQLNENDNNKNRKYSVVDERINKTYAKDSKATLNTKLYDAYVKFFRWAVDRLRGRDGIICFVSNNSFVDQIAFDGMRKNLLKDFNQIYHLDLHGNVRKNPKLSGTTHNVFGIQVGVGITIAARISSSPARKLYYYRVPEFWRKTEKLAFLARSGNIDGITWQELLPDEKYNWITEGLQSDFANFLPMGTKEAKLARQAEVQTLFKTYSLGISTNRDSVVYNFNYQNLSTRIESFIENYNAEVARWFRNERPKDVDNFVHYDKIKWSRNLKRDLQNEHYAQFTTEAIRKSLVRPYLNKWLYYADILIDERGTTNSIFPTAFAENENKTICISGVGSNKPFQCLVSNTIPCLDLLEKTQCFPYYTYAEDGSSRRENITDWALAQFRAQYGDAVTKWDIFHYVYAMLHHPMYRERYAENLKRDLPRIPLLPEREAFAICVRVGKALMELHLHYETVKPYRLTPIENREVPVDWRVKKMKLTPAKDAVIVNEWLTLANVPQECFQYRLGNRSALEWVLDQYQVSKDARSEIVSDPNCDDDPQYIAQLVQKVVRVSMETMALVRELEEGVRVVEGE